MRISNLDAPEEDDPGRPYRFCYENTMKCILLLRAIIKDIFEQLYEPAYTLIEVLKINCSFSIQFKYVACVAVEWYYTV